MPSLYLDIKNICALMHYPKRAHKHICILIFLHYHFLQNNLTFQCETMQTCKCNLTVLQQARKLNHASSSMGEGQKDKLVWGDWHSLWRKRQIRTNLLRKWYILQIYVVIVLLSVMWISTSDNFFKKIHNILGHLIILHNLVCNSTKNFHNIYRCISQM